MVVNPLMSDSRFTVRRLAAILSLALTLLCLLHPAQVKAAAPAEALPIMGIDDVRVGMKGYGLTVFHGVDVEPFPVEVVSIMHSFGPKKGVVWIRCPDERMQLSGPVQGMSGSPIFLWDEGKTGTIGDGGKLIGAFAFGYSLGKDCYVGVQPIESMRAITNRINDEADDAAQSNSRKPDGDAAYVTLSRLLNDAQSLGVSGRSTYRLEAIIKALQPEGEQNGHRAAAYESSSSAGARSFPRPPVEGGRPLAMQLPIAVPRGPVSHLASRMFDAAGLRMFEAPMNMTVSRPPAGIEIDKVEMSPGSVLAIPLAFGDLDLSATGTVTEVLPDGTVLGFGHQMFGEGGTSLPMASGFVHFVQPSVQTSFKLSGSGNIKGSMVRDESSGVVGQDRITFTTAPVKVTIDLAGQPTREYNYQVVHHHQLTPVLAAIVAVRSLTAEQQVPPENTVTITGNVKFENGMSLDLKKVSPNGGDYDVFSMLAMPVVSMSQNPFEKVMLESVEIAIKVEDQPRTATLIAGQVLDPVLRPGQTAEFSVELRPFGEEKFRKRVSIDIPQTLPDGMYDIAVVDAQTYLGLMMTTRPHLSRITSVDELHAVLGRVMSVRDEALYVVMMLPEQGLAIGREELPSLPSSQRAMIQRPERPEASPYQEWATEQFDTDYVPSGGLTFRITVDRQAAE